MAPPAIDLMNDAASEDSYGSGDSSDGVSLLELASNEIEAMRKKSLTQQHYHKFPPACWALLKSVEGNQRCVDCGDRNPQWAAVSYGALLCLQCSGHHRSLGVQVSCVRSVSMDEWSLEHVVNMLEGGSAQLQEFFARHALVPESFYHNPNEPTRATTINKSNVTRLRYKTKAALFYRQQMALHIRRVLQAGPYRGREMSRRLQHHQQQRNVSTTTTTLE